jgi:hypothetical protein
MELLRLIHVLRRRRFYLAAGFFVALAMALAMGVPPPSSSALAWTTVTLDTPRSQLVESAPSGADTLPWRASLLVHLMASDETTKQLASRLGVRPDQVFVVDTYLDEPQVPASMPTSAAKAAGFTVAPYVLTVYVTDSQLPMISLEAAGPDRAGATRLAQAAVDVLESQSVTSDARYSSPILTGGGAALKYQPYVVQQVAPVRTKIVVSHPLPMKQVVVPLLLLAIWSAGVVLVPPLVRRVRARAPHAAAA